MLSVDFLDVSGIVAMLKHDPAAVIGFLLVGASATLCFHLHRKLLAVGQDTSALFFRIPNTAIFTRSTRIPHCPFKEWLVTMACIPWYRDSSCWSWVYFGWRTETCLDRCSSGVLSVIEDVSPINWRRDLTHVLSAPANMRTTSSRGTSTPLLESLRVESTRAYQCSV